MLLASSRSRSVPRCPRGFDRAAPAPARSRRRPIRQCRAWSGQRPPTPPALRVTIHLSLWREARGSGGIPPQAWSLPRYSPYAMTGTGMIGHCDRPHQLGIYARPGLSLCDPSTGRLHDPVLGRRRDLRMRLQANSGNGGRQKFFFRNGVGSRTSGASHDRNAAGPSTDVGATRLGGKA